MKKHLLIAGIAVLSTSAYATTTRLQALGQDTTRGSFFIDDNYNVFRNAAYVNMYKNYTVTEWGMADGNETTGEQQLEGGFFREMGNFAYGVYFNNESDTAETISATRAINGVTLIDITAGGDNSDNFKQSDNAIDLFFGGDMGVQWGARIQYAKSSDTVSAADAKLANGGTAASSYEREHSAMNISLGAIMGDLAGYANIGIKNEYLGAGGDANNDGVLDDGEGDADSRSDKLEGTGSINLGVNYKMGNMKFYVDYASGGMEHTDATSGSFVNTYDQTQINVGVGHTHEVSSTARVFSQVAFVKTDLEWKTSETVTVESSSTALPLTIGFEADANSWLTIRGYVAQNLPFLDSSETTNSATTGDDNTDTETKGGESTEFGAGATLNFGKLKIDGVISNGTGATAEDLRTDLLLSKVAVIYNF